MEQKRTWKVQITLKSYYSGFCKFLLVAILKKTEGEISLLATSAAKIRPAFVPLNPKIQYTYLKTLDQI